MVDSSNIAFLKNWSYSNVNEMDSRLVPIRVKKSYAVSAQKIVYGFCKFHEKLELLTEGDRYKGQNIFELI